MQTPTSPIRLTQTVQKGGCAAKIAALELRKILAEVRFPNSPAELLIDTKTFDDAAIYKVSHDLALVQTLDFFTPIVDTPKLFGRIAAANALSDVYAMGGKPVTAMAIFAFPISTLDPTVAIDVLQGASDTIAEAQAALVGGHSIDDDTLKFGLSVTGFVHPDRIWSNAGAKTGDMLILTKPLGTGTLTAALKRGEVTEADIQDGLASMCLLNDVASCITADLLPHIHAATDITGFGLVGHALNMATASNVSLHFDTQRIPHFTRALELLQKGFLTKAHRTNKEYVAGQIQFDQANTNLEQLVCDPQTSGGLLLAVSADFAIPLLAQIQKQFGAAQIIGQVQQQDSKSLKFA